MKKILKYIFVLLLSTQTNAVHLSSSGIGQVLVFPYYTVRNNMNTLITVVNTSDQVKALKIRFSEGRNSRQVVDFNLYLGPFDVWTAGLIAITSTGIGVDFEDQESVKILTNDTSCTVPAINGQDFLPFAFSGDYDDGLIQDMIRVTEGSIEIIEMAEVIGSDAAAAMYTGSASVPANCASLNNNWLFPAGKWLNDPTINMVAPDGTGDLFGSVSIIDVIGGVDMSYDATAIVAYNTEISHTSPGSIEPNLASGNNSTTLLETEDGIIQTTWNSPLHAVTALFMQAQIINDFVIESGIGAQTEWINFSPTKQYYIDPLFSDSTTALGPFSIDLTDDVGACAELRFKAYNREQGLDQNDLAFPVLPPHFVYVPEHCWSINVGDVDGDGDDTNTLFNSSLTMVDWAIGSNNNPIYQLSSSSGWMQMDFSDERSSPGKLVGTGKNGEIHTIIGKPVLGFVAQKYVNGTLDDGNGNNVLANYAVINMNKSIKKITVEPIVSRK